MTKTTPEVAQAFVNLRQNSDFQTVLMWLEVSEAKATQTCTQHDGLPLYRAQGEVAALSEIRKVYAIAPAALKSFQSTPRPKVNTL